MKYMNIIINKSGAVRLIIVIFYCVGIIGFLFSPTKEIFIKLIPFALILSFGLLLLFNETEINIKSTIAFCIILVISFFVEVIGVKTGILFGNYYYGNSLGYKLFNTPLIIGVNWLFMVYTSAVVVQKIKLPSFLKIIFASCVMVLYDGVLEQVAPKLDMWHWNSNEAPIQNYITWFMLALLFHLMLDRLQIIIKNRIAKMLLICQFLFFLILFIAPRLMQ